MQHSADRVPWRANPPARVVLTNRVTEAADRSVVTSGAPAFAVTTEESSGVVFICGEFDVAAVACFAAAAASLTVGRRGDVTVDLTATTFVDAAGLGALVALRAAQLREGHGLRLRGCPARVRRVFVAGGLAELLPGVG